MSRAKVLDSLRKFATTYTVDQNTLNYIATYRHWHPEIGSDSALIRLAVERLVLSDAMAQQLGPQIVELEPEETPVQRVAKPAIDVIAALFTSDER